MEGSGEWRLLPTIPIMRVGCLYSNFGIQLSAGCAKEDIGTYSAWKALILTYWILHSFKKNKVKFDTSVMFQAALSNKCCNKQVSVTPEVDYVTTVHILRNSIDSNNFLLTVADSWCRQY